MVASILERLQHKEKIILDMAFNRSHACLPDEIALQSGTISVRINLANIKRLAVEYDKNLNFFVGVKNTTQKWGQQEKCLVAYTLLGTSHNGAPAQQKVPRSCEGAATWPSPFQCCALLGQVIARHLHSLPAETLQD